jgi:hypothetical protein
LAVLLTGAVALTGACTISVSNRSDPTTTTTRRSATSTTAALFQPRPLGSCVPTPPAVAMFTWVPADLPLPPGTFATKELLAGPPTGQGLFVAPVSLVEFVKFANAEWPKHGWAQGRGEAEPGEAESTFVRASPAADGTRQGGAWRVRETYCEPRQVELLLVYKQ